MTASKSKWLVGSSNNNKSERQINACAKFKRIRQPPENDFTGNESCSVEKPKPFNNVAARAWIVQASMVSSWA